MTGKFYNGKPRVRMAVLASAWVVLSLATAALTCGEIERRTEAVDPMYHEDEIDVMVDYGATLQAQETARANDPGPPKEPAGASEDVPELPADSAPPVEAPAPAEVQDFSGSWNSSATCDEEDAPYRWRITLRQDPNTDVVSGTIEFHACPGGGRATYNVTGTATTSDVLFLEGTKTGGRGGLNGIAPAEQTFRVSRGAEPFPNLAP